MGAGVGDLVVGGPSARVGGHSVDDGFEYEKSKFLHSAHDSNSDGDSKWAKFNNDTNMENTKLKKEILFSNREMLKEAIRQYGRMNRYNVKFNRNEK